MSKQQGEKIQEDETAWWLAVGSHSRMAGKNNNKGEGGGASRGRISIHPRSASADRSRHLRRLRCFCNGLSCSAEDF